jgi:hypothetical protein
MNQGVRNFRFIALAFALLCVIALPSISVFGQDISGNLVGTVTDSSGAAVVGAEVEATNSGTNVTNRSKTNGAGQYRIDNLLPGTYKVTVRASGFKASSQTADVQLNMTGTINVTLTLGAATETVEVSGAPPIIDTTTAQLQTTYEPLEVNEVATSSFGLGVINLSLLQAGVGSTGGLGAGTGPAVGGQRPRDNNFTIEGVDNNDKGVTGPILYIPNDAVENFTVIQNQFSPEFGHSAGGQFNTSIKSGTNTFHGTAYEYFQNRNLNAVDNLVVLNGATTNPRYDNNRFGGTIGGPLIKNKVFFFFNYEFNPIGQSATPAPVTAPTANGYAQILAVNPSISTPNVQAFQKWIQAASNDAGQINICSQQLPLGSCVLDGGSLVPVDIGNVPIIAPNYNNTTAWLISGDYNISDKDQIRVRYVKNRNSFIDTAPTLPAFYNVWSFPYHLGNIAEFHSFGPSLSNEFRVGYHRSAQFFTIGNQTFLPTLDAFPNLTMDDLGGLNLGPDPNGPQFAVQNLYQALDNVTWIKGNHTLKFGFEGRKSISPQKFIQRSRGDYDYPFFSDFAYDLTPAQDQGFSERSFGNSGYSGDQYALYGYVNDIWKFRPNLSLNLGLRYEYTSTPFGWTQQSLNAISNVPGLITFGSPQAPKKDFMPRIGFAYSPGNSGTMSIRGGFGISYDVLYDNIGVLERPPQIGSTIDCPAQCVDNAFLANGGIPPQSLSGISVLDQATARATTSAALPNNVKYPYAESWNLGISRTFGTNYTAEVRYVGSRGVDLNVQNRLNILSIVNSSNNLPTFLTCDATCTALENSSGNTRTLANLTTAFGNQAYLDPRYTGATCSDGVTNCGFFSAITAYEPWGASTYHAMQAQLDRRFSHGLYLQGAYTFSHTIDNATADFFSTVIAPRRPQDFQNLPAERSNSVLDHRNRLTLSLVYEPQMFLHSSNWLLRNVAGGYSISPTYIYETGQLGTVQSGRDANLNNDSAPDRTIINPHGVGNTGSDVTAIQDLDLNTVGYLAVNPNAKYIRAGTGALADSGRGTLPSPPINNWDLTVSKTLKFRERFQFRMQFQALNLLNHPEFTTGAVNIANSISITGTGQRNVLIPNSGNIGANVFDNFKSEFSSNSRLVQLGAKFIF